MYSHDLVLGLIDNIYDAAQWPIFLTGFVLLTLCFVAEQLCALKPMHSLLNSRFRHSFAAHSTRGYRRAPRARPSPIVSDTSSGCIGPDSKKVNIQRRISRWLDIGF